MQYYIFWAASPERLAQVESELLAYGAVQSPEFTGIMLQTTGGEELYFHLQDSKMSLVSHLQAYPVDLLVYDESGGGIDAIKGVAAYKKEVEQLRSQWGPDFYFPLQRVITLLSADSGQRKSFLLGREQVRDILFAPIKISDFIDTLLDNLRTDQKQRGYRLGCALSGGGIEGYLYQLGCAYALHLALGKHSLYDCDIFSGISSGSLLATSLSHGIPLNELLASLQGYGKVLPPVTSRLLYDPAFGEIGARLLRHSFTWRRGEKLSQKAGRSIPTGFFKGKNLKNYIHNAITTYGYKDTFQSMDKELFIGATDQDRLDHVVFGLEPWADVPVSEAVRASCALPPFFLPSTIKGRRFIDGMVSRTCNIELLVERGCSLVFIIDPMRPYPSWERGYNEALGGVHTLIQSVKSLVSTRFRTSLTHLSERYHNVDFLIFQPYGICAEAMAGLPMKYRLQTDLVTLAFQSTLQRLIERHSIYRVKLARHGLHLISAKHLAGLKNKSLSEIQAETS